MSEIAEKITPFAQEAAETVGCGVVDVEYVKEGQEFFLRVYIEKTEGNLDLDECAAVSRYLSGLLDVEDCVPGVYRLEVSSPGLTRPLKKEADYIRFVGHLVAVKTYMSLKDLDGKDKGRLFKGKLLGLNDGQVRIMTEQGEIVVPLSGISKANLDVEF
ncbi:MAG: ribosome maturation factor RimP [Magnetococcales bacterium]|nr:ribosome maturation factor RimP [Magnetococcales bacterium]